MMNQLKACTLTFLLAGFVFPQQSLAANVPPLSNQLKQVIQWFTGKFDNSQNVASNPAIPLINMRNCSVQLAGGGTDGTGSVYLEQQSPVFNRVRFYSFGLGSGTINLGIRSFINSSSLSGICDRPASERIISQDNLAAAVCSLNLTYEPNRYVGNNAPNGCPTITGGKVVSDVSIQANSINSLDQIFDSSGKLLAGSRINFQRLATVPESSPLAGFAITGAGLIFLNRRKQQEKRVKSVKQS
ncbi:MULTISPECIES: chromophore lyase CpcT/CpeT [Calothrix]|uniref:Chromophore lyase CpcT/CpeT n=2 Tax=Calothrix TaxID=1186 RepID=A0ABR8ABJ2_9CYAN|nr:MULTISPECIES: chromophore lyase CpcT/CpeT [Calothrix]MBD2197074.1 chromophore lyase CpcT/CpeT [Calothrix parietina FACHB-288]MBD2225705.1 chromophore lyase CpcT/CpeT [Calothrix anomala FACHB-343]